MQEIVVSPTGYSPKEIVLESGKQSTINFRTEEGTGCLTTVLSDKLGINSVLKEGSNNYLNIKALEPGTYEYACGMNMYKGTITVK
ncbi:cupredoxin domain-containing protein [Neobacillus niacini]|uniref:cupredoxin domain-containing protein n=1 Tax=Neobacillus niacini TaxID=86668 RepID=UPI00351C88CD